MRRFLGCGITSDFLLPPPWMNKQLRVNVFSLRCCCNNSQLPCAKIVSRGEWMVQLRFEINLRVSKGASKVTHQRLPLESTTEAISRHTLFTPPRSLKRNSDFLCVGSSPVGQVNNLVYWLTNIDCVSSGQVVETRSK